MLLFIVVCMNMIFAGTGTEPHTQRVPRSQRGGEVIEPMVSSQWFVRTTNMAERAVQAVRTGDIAILPDRYEKVWYNWLENIHDWCVSRQLWWGHRIPVYYVNKPPDAGIAVAVVRRACEYALIPRDSVYCIHHVYLTINFVAIMCCRWQCERQCQRRYGQAVRGGPVPEGGAADGCESVRSWSDGHPG